MTEENTVEPGSESSAATESEETLLKFPCRFSVKAMGANEPGFSDLVAAMVREHAPEPAHHLISERPSSKGNYLAVTVTFTATSKTQLDAIYRQLSAHDRIKVAL